jgi:hypothetical protein
MDAAERDAYSLMRAHRTIAEGLRDRSPTRGRLSAPGRGRSGAHRFAIADQRIPGWRHCDGFSIDIDALAAEPPRLAAMADSPHKVGKFDVAEQLADLVVKVAGVLTLGHSGFARGSCRSRPGMTGERDAPCQASCYISAT